MRLLGDAALARGPEEPVHELSGRSRPRTGRGRGSVDADQVTGQHLTS
jgi:hypothetical protein